MGKGFEFRASTLDERKEFYETEFSVEKARKWFSDNGIELPQICVLDAGTDTGIIVDKKFKGKLLYLPFDKLIEKLRQYNPESVYYERNKYKNPEKVLETLKFDNPISQELDFDIDVDNIRDVKKENTEDYETTIKEAFEYTLELKKELEKKFRKIRMVYSGRGFHLHVLDKEAYFLSPKERERLAEEFSKYPIDSWVTRSHMRLIRLPYSLNGRVSRIVAPLSDDKFEPEKAIPKFLQTM